jgi:hypothetical protein
MLGYLIWHVAVAESAEDPVLSKEVFVKSKKIKKITVNKFSKLYCWDLIPR